MPSRTRKGYRRRRLLCEILENRRLLTADPASWLLDVDDQWNAFSAVTDDGDVVVAGELDQSNGPLGVKKYTSTGSLDWSASFDPPAGTMFVHDVSVDAAESVYVAGHFDGTLDFGSAGILQSGGGNNDFLVKLDAAGNPLWAQSFATSGAQGLAIHGTDVYLAGYFGGSKTFGTTTLQANGTQDGFIVKMNSSGNVQWAKQVASSGSTGGFVDDVVVQEVGGNIEVFVAAKGSGETTLDSITLPGHGSEEYLVLAKLNDNLSAASFAWAVDYGTSVWIGGLAVDGNGGVFVAGRDFVTGVGDNGSSATIDWVNQMGDNALMDHGLAFADGSLIVATRFSGANEFQSTDSNSLTIVSRGGDDAAVARYDVDGKLKTVQRLGGSDDEWLGYLIAKDDIAYMQAWTTSGSLDADFPADAPTSTHPDAFANKIGGQESYILKLNPSAPIVHASDPVTTAAGNIVTLSASATSGDLSTDLSSSIVWTDQAGTNLGIGPNIDLSFDMGTHLITASVENAAGLEGIAGVVVNAVDPNVPLQVFDDSFESGIHDLWSSGGGWVASTQRSTVGSQSLEVDGNVTDTTHTVVSPIDLSNMASAELTFDWFIERGFDGGEYLALGFSSDGSTWDEILSLDGNVDQENSWHSEAVQLDPQYLTSGFQFRYRATVSHATEDANVDNVLLTALVNAGPPNQSPSITSMAVSVGTQDAPYQYDVDASDPDPSDTLTYSLDVAPASMTIDPNTGVISWTPSSSQIGLNSVTVRVQDQSGGADTQTFEIDVANVNDPPSIDSSPVTAATPGEVYSYDVDASDPDPCDVLNYTLDDGPSGMTIDSNTGVISWTPGGADLGSHSVMVRVEDVAGESDMQSFDIDVSLLSAIYVYDIRFEPANGGRYRAVFEIREDSNSDGQKNASDQAVSGVAIEVEFAGKTYQGTTDSSGVFRTGTVKLKSGNHYANAVDLALSGYAWTPFSILGEEDDSDGDGRPDDVLTI